jgi:hypothetical protein
MNYLINHKTLFVILLCIVVVILVSTLFSHRTPSLQIQSSPQDLLKAYAKKKGKSYQAEGLPEQRDFNVVIGPFFFRYIASSSELIASGYVASGQVALVGTAKHGEEDWRWLITYAKLQPTTLGGGELELYTGEFDPLSKKPAVYLSRTYRTPFPSQKQFIDDMNRLAQFSTYWRDERWGQIFSSRTDKELRKEAEEAEVWAKKQ